MRLAVLSSGSKGNALFVEHDDTAVLIDCGLTPKVLRRRLKERDRKLQDLDAIVLTHGHGDHAGGAARVAGPFKLRIYATRGTQRMRAKGGGLPNFVPVNASDPFRVGTLTFNPFSVPHDAPESVGYVVESDDGARLGVCTDIGRPTLDVARALRGVDTLYLEYNHDERMLMDGPYPPKLKRRVKGPLGHLSNAQAAELTERCYTPRLGRLLLAHLSESNNTPHLALKAAKHALAGTGVQLVIAEQHASLPFVDVVRPGERKPLAKKPAPVVESPAPVHKSVAVRRQLELFGGKR